MQYSVSHVYSRSFFKNESKVNGHSSIPKVDNGKYPDASKWTTDDVVQFIISVGFNDQAEAFREQVIVNNGTQIIY